jgi:hypothetical protein
VQANTRIAIAIFAVFLINTSAGYSQPTGTLAAISPNPYPFGAKELSASSHRLVLSGASLESFTVAFADALSLHAGINSREDLKRYRVFVQPTPKGTWIGFLLGTEPGREAHVEACQKHEWCEDYMYLVDDKMHIAYRSLSQ